MQSWKELLKWWGLLIYFFSTCNKNLSVALLYIGYRETSGMNVWEARILIQHTSQWFKTRKKKWHQLNSDILINFYPKVIFLIIHLNHRLVSVYQKNMHNDSFSFLHLKKPKDKKCHFHPFNISIPGKFYDFRGENIVRTHKIGLLIYRSSSPSIFMIFL